MPAFKVAEIVTEEQSTPLELIVNGAGYSDVAYLDQLRVASSSEVEAAARAIQTRLGLKSEISSKRAEAALDKCRRESTLKKYPWFKLCHLRDYLRFRTHLATGSDFASVLELFAEWQESKRISLVKIDIEKLRRPSPFGWRVVATDIRIVATGMIVEHYMTFSSMIEINEAWLHKVYENWRSRSTDAMTMKELSALDRDSRFSRHAFREFLFDGILATNRSPILRASRRSLQEEILQDLLSRLNKYARSRIAPRYPLGPTRPRGPALRK